MFLSTNLEWLTLVDIINFQLNLCKKQRILISLFRHKYLNQRADFMFRNKFIYIIFIALLIIPLLFAFILFLEFFTGNGDGILFDLDIKVTAFNTLLILSITISTIYLFIYGPKLIQGIVFFIILTSLLIWGLEKASSYILYLKEPKQATTTTTSKPFLRPDYTDSFVEDDTLGVKAKPNWKLKWLPVKDNITYDSIFISVDSMSRRITPAIDSLPRKNFAVFLGCSYTYGDGVTDSETLPFYFQKYTSNFKPYNYGFLAYSPLHMLALLKHYPLKKTVKETDGVGIYTMINDHLDRVIPASRWVDMTNGKFPYLNTKTMTTDGIFCNKRRLYTYLIKNFHNSGIQRLFNIGYPRVHTTDHFILLNNIITEAREAYKKQFKNDRFYVVIFPGNPVSPELMQLMKQSKLKVLDYSDLLHTPNKLLPYDVMLPFDVSHPKGELYNTVAAQLAKDVRL